MNHRIYLKFTSSPIFISEVAWPLAKNNPFTGKFDHQYYRAYIPDGNQSPELSDKELIEVYQHLADRKLLQFVVLSE